jgi:Tol biopolymer transport system component
MNADGSNIRRLTDNQQLDTSPTWSPDGQRIAFISDFKLHLINLDGTNFQQVTNSDDFYARSLLWFLDGQRIGFLYDTAGAIYTVDIESQSIVPLEFRMPLADIDGWWP